MYMIFDLLTEMSRHQFDLVALAAPHREYLAKGDALPRALAPGGTLGDLKGVLGNTADWTL